MIISEYTRDTVNIWFPTQREPLYDPEDEVLDRQFREYWAQEKDRLIYGFEINGVFISGWLYWHTVYWTIVFYKKDPRSKRKKKEQITPELWDLVWDIASDFTECERLGKFYILVGARDFGKTVIAASRTGYLYTLFDDSESVISSSESQYISIVTEKVEAGLINLHPVLQKKRLLNDWKKEIKAGFKDKDTGIASASSSNSSIKMRNYENGNDTMAAVGTRPGFHLIDEIGTLPNLVACVKDSDPCWRSGEDEQPSCLVMLTGTGGDMEVGLEASHIFYNPDAYDMLSFENIWEPESASRIGRFVSALRAKRAFKEPQRLVDYIGREAPGLQHITILVANEQRALKEWWEVDYDKARKTGNPQALLKFQAYNPLKPSHSFLVLSKNDFNVMAAQTQQARIRTLEKTGVSVKLFHDGNKIVHSIVDDLPISEFPLKTQSGDAPIVIWEFPVEENPPFGLYTAGVDPYRFGESEYSDSLGAVYIFKRIHDIAGERYQNLFVAAYVARPKSKEQWNETARLLIKYYNAYTLCENDEYSFIDYMIKVGDASRYLCPQPDWLREIVPNTSVKREYGIHRSNERIRRHLDGLFQKYLDEVIYQDKDEHGSIIKEHLGVTRVFDPMLLEEIIKFNRDTGNYDRLIAAELAIALADHLNPQFIVGEVDADPRLKSYFSRQKSAASVVDFSGRSNLYHGKRRNKMFY